MKLYYLLIDGFPLENTYFLSEMRQSYGLNNFQLFQLHSLLFCQKMLYIKLFAHYLCAIWMGIDFLPFQHTDKLHAHMMASHFQMIAFVLPTSIIFSHIMPTCLRRVYTHFVMQV